MASSNLLITGVTGYIGFKVLLVAIETGYSVRAAVRSHSQAAAIVSHPKIKALAPGDKLSFVEVPNLVQDDAFDQAMKDITYAIHIASPLPLPNRDPQADIFEPTIKGAANFLASAHKVPSVKRVVITSSIVANMPFPPDATMEITAESRVPDFAKPATEVFPAYWAAKVATMNATDKFVRETKPAFTVVNVIPGFVYGKNDKALDTKGLLTGSNRLILAILLGQSFDIPRLAGAAHVDDVAKVHLLALKDDVKGDFGVTAPVVYDDAFEIVKKHFPKAVEDGVFTQGHQPSQVINWNAAKTEDVFQFKFKTYEDMVVDVAGQYLEFSGKEKA